MRSHCTRQLSELILYAMANMGNKSMFLVTFNDRLNVFQTSKGGVKNVFRLWA